MSGHPINLALRFILELIAWFAPGYWGWTQHTGPARWLLAIGLPLLSMSLWGVFRVPGDPGSAPVAVPGWVRLLLEALVFGGAAWAFYASGKPGWAIFFGAVVIIHYLISFDRVLWMVRGSNPEKRPTSSLFN